MTMVPPSTSSSVGARKVVDQAILQSWVRAYSEDRRDAHHSSDPDEEHSETRSGSDARAAFLKWHQGLCIGRFTETERPWYLALERARVECLAARELPGVARNLRGLSVKGIGLAPSLKDIYVAARSVWGFGFEGQSPSRDLPGGGILQKLWGLIARTEYPELQSVEVRSSLASAGQHLGNEEAFARAVHPLVSRLSQSSTRGRVQDCDTNEPDSPERSESEDEAELGYGTEQQPERYSRVGNYAIFRTAWDQCEPAKVWHQPEDEKALRSLNALDRRKIQKLAHQLQRRLLAMRLRQWDFELEEGVLDSRKLAALVGDHPDHRVFKFEREARIPEACVTLLVDQSGSMRGSAHLLAAQAIDFAVHTLEVCGISSEVLGFTTRYGAENPVVDIWRDLGSPACPGRMNALRHIIFKAAGQPWRVARKHLGLLLRTDFGFENIDGESLFWAARRLLARPEPRKILIVLSDGSPYDEATITSNQPQFLADHLMEVIQAVEQTPIQLIGIGTGRDVGRFYSHAATIRRGDMVGEVLFAALGDSLDQAARP